MRPRRSPTTPWCSTRTRSSRRRSARSRAASTCSSRAPTRARDRIWRSSRAARTNDSPGERNDVTMLVHITDNPRRVTVVSFPRDMLVAIPACDQPDGGQVSRDVVGEDQRVVLSTAASRAPPRPSRRSPARSIEFAAAIRWTGVINMSDAIGGVDVCVAGEISDKHTGLHLTEGPHTLVGAEALQFLRIRHGIGDGSDLGRISNQQQFMSSMVRKLQSESVLANPGTLLNSRHHSDVAGEPGPARAEFGTHEPRRSWSRSPWRSRTSRTRTSCSCSTRP